MLIIKRLITLTNYKPFILLKRHILFKGINDLFSLMNKDTAFNDKIENDIFEYQNFINKAKNDDIFFVKNKIEDGRFKIPSIGLLRSRSVLFSNVEEKTTHYKKNRIYYNLSLRLMPTNPPSFNNLNNKIITAFSDFQLYLECSITNDGMEQTVEDSLSISLDNKKYSITISYDKNQEISSIKFNDTLINNNNFIISNNSESDNLIKDFYTQYKTNNINETLLYGCLDQRYDEEISLIELMTDDYSLVNYKYDTSQTIFEMVS